MLCGRDDLQCCSVVRPSLETFFLASRDKKNGR